MIRQNRGFTIGEFKDAYGMPSSIQMSSNVNPHIWLGADEPTVIKDGTILARMHLTPEMARELAIQLNYFADHHELLEDRTPEDYDANVKAALAIDALDRIEWIIGMVKKGESDF